MPLRELVLHQDGPALWPDHKPLAEVLTLKESTLDPIWNALYQGEAAPPGGYIFKRSWWGATEGTRYDYYDQRFINACYARYISIDTALKDRPEADTDYTAVLVGELWPDYRLAVREVHAERLEFPDLPGVIESWATRFNRDGKLRTVLIEDKSSGTSAYQTLQRSSQHWLRPLLFPFMPTTDKITRAKQAAVWAKRKCILLPELALDLFWLADFEDQIFNFPQWPHDDMLDALTQLILYLENILEAGYNARGGSEHDI